MAAYLNWRKAKGLESNPDILIKECKLGNNMILEQHLDVLKDWAEGEAFDGKDLDTRKKYYTDIRGFYLANRVTLPQESLNLKKQLNDEVEVPKKAYEVTAKEFLKMASLVINSPIDVRDRSIMMTMIQSGMDDSTLAKNFNFVAFDQLSKHFGTSDFRQWDESKVPVRIDLVRTKTYYRYYTCLGYDAIVCLKQYLAFRVSQFGEIKVFDQKNPRLLPVSNAIYLTKDGRPIQPWTISELFRESGKKAGVNIVPESERLRPYQGASRRYPFHSHECRDTLITLGRRAGVDLAIVNFFAGHPIDKLHYDKDPWDCPEHFLEEYSKLMRYLDLISGKEREIKEQVIEEYKPALGALAGILGTLQNLPIMQNLESYISKEEAAKLKDQLKPNYETLRKLGLLKEKE